MLPSAVPLVNQLTGDGSVQPSRTHLRPPAREDMTAFSEVEDFAGFLDDSGGLPDDLPDSDILSGKQLSVL